MLSRVAAASSSHCKAARCLLSIPCSLPGRLSTRNAGTLQAAAGKGSDAPPPSFAGVKQPSFLPFSGLGDLQKLPVMKSGEVRRLAEAAASEGADKAVWDGIAERCMISAEHLQHWDVVQILQAFTAAGIKNEPLFERLGEVLVTKTSKLAPKHVLDLFAVYEAQGLRLRSLYVELFHSMIRLSRSMYAEELSLSLQALARYGLGNPTVVAHLVRAVVRDLSDFRLRYLCGVTGSLGALNCTPQDLLAELDKQARLEVETVPVQELLDNMNAFPLLEYSWAPYEEMNWKELQARVASYETQKDIDQFVDPFEALDFLQARSALPDSFLLAMTQWCLHGVHLPNVRTERRPTSEQLVKLHELCKERGLEETPALQDAIAYYLESAGGLWQPIMPKPLMFKKKRMYIRKDDPLEGTELEPIPYPYLPLLERAKDVPQASRAAASDDLFGSPLPETQVAQPEGMEAESELDNLMVEPPRWSAATPITEIVRVKRYKPSGRSPLLTQEESLVHCWITSRRSPKDPRLRPGPGLRAKARRDVQREPLWYNGGWGTRPKYQRGVATPRYPWKGVPPGNRGAKRILRR
mmetsp:Transcript_37468/g.79479  ORF Transcript_37468/g.79479 Transcript_37468/m.79479 type:complete len:581 (-) Transcript_37468:223-1965(-)